MKKLVGQIRGWIEDLSGADRETKWFVFNWAIYGVIIVVTAIYCYVRLDYVRSYEALPPDSEFRDNQSQ